MFTVLHNFRECRKVRAAIPTRSGPISNVVIPTNRAPEACTKITWFPLLLAKWAGPGSNRRHMDFQSIALPTELPARDLANWVTRRRFPGGKGEYPTWGSYVFKWPMFDAPSSTLPKEERPRRRS